MKKTIQKILVFLLLHCFFVLPVFAQDGSALPQENPRGSEAVSSENNAAAPAEEGRAAEAAPRVIEAGIRISSSSYKTLISSEEKKPLPINVSVDQKEYEAAQINIRGNSSRQFGLATPTRRIPFEITYYDKEPFGGLENSSLKFINSFYPYRLIAEYLALDLFSFAEIPTPAHSFAFVRFNDVDFGLYLAVEDVNKAFLSKWYPEPLHSAYKATINAEKESECMDTAWFGNVFEKVSGASDLLPSLLAALDKGEGFEQYINVDEWLRYFACVAVTGGDGSIFTEKNNFVLYDNNGKFELIPWDLSESFSGKRIPDHIDRFYIWGDENQPNALFDLLMRNRSYKEQYHHYIRTYTEGFLSPENLQKRYDAILNAISTYLPRDRSILLNSETALSDLRSASPDSFSNLRYMLQAYYQNLLAQLDGKENAFPVNEQFADYYELGDSFENIISVCEPLSPLLDPSLPRQIMKQGRQDGHTLAVLIVCVAAALGFLIWFVLDKRNAHLQTHDFSVKRLPLYIKNMLVKHKIMFCFLLFLLLYESIFSWGFRGWEVGGYPYIYHALDYSFGFCSRLLPGAVSHALLGEVSVVKATVLETVLLLLFFVCLAWFAEKLYLRFDKAERPYGCMLIFLFLTGPCSFGIYVKELGMLDAWWLYTTVIVLFLLSKKKLRPLIVVFAFVLSAIYFASILCFAPFVVIILLYRAGLEAEAKDRRRLYIIAWAFAFVAIGSTVYFISSGASNIKLAPEDFFSLLHARGCSGDVEEVYRVLYSIPPEESGIAYGTTEEMLREVGVKTEFMAQIIIRLRQHFTIFLESSKTRYLQPAYSLLLIGPVLAMLVSFFRQKRKSSKNPMQKFVFFCMSALFFFVVFSSLFVSTDYQKWLAHGFTLAFACFLIVLYHEPQAFSACILPRLRRYPTPVLVCFCIIYAAVVFHPYS